MEGQPEKGQFDGSTAVEPLRLSDAPKKMTEWAVAAEAMGLPDRSSLTIDEQVAGEPMWLP